MNVRELIAELQKLDQESLVVAERHKGGFDEIFRVGEIQLRLNVHSGWYYGKHEEDKGGECRAVYIG